METIAFVHFSINTFTDMEWGYGNESPKLFNPTNLDCRQWVKICKEAGMKGIILTAKHHDGFCLWPSKYTEYSVKNSPWKKGKGDVIREFADACKEYDMKMGLYLSPWDCNHPDYGNPKYNEYFKKQLKELLTNYGEVFEIWFDGANGGRGFYGTDKLHTRTIDKDYYNWDEFEEIVKTLQPNCIIHGGKIADVRWVGNEEGYAAKTHWSTMHYADSYVEDMPVQYQLNTGHENGIRWFPSETDVSIRPGWYYHDSENHKIKSVPKLLDIYYESVGRNSLLLLNLSPNKQGRIFREDSLRLINWRKQLDLDFENNLIDNQTNFVANNQNQLKYAFDGDFNTFWKSNTEQAQIEIDFGKEQVFNRLVLQEYINEGQRIKRFTIKALVGNNWKNIIKGTTIGYKRILRLPDIATNKLQIHIEEALDQPLIADISIYNAPLVLSSPKIERNQKGEVSIMSPDKSGHVFYTLDGSDPSKNGLKYKAPFICDDKVTIKAVVINNETQGEIAERKFGPSKAQWKVVRQKGDFSKLFDGLSETTWIAKGDDVKSIVVDFGSKINISGLTYLPDQSRGNIGIALDFQIQVSRNGKHWKTMAEGEFSNIRNNPILQEIGFKRNSKVRFIKFITKTVADGQNALAIAELDVLSK
ncbi:alpha-L-fucosidase [Aestuariibaculum sp. M13]|uniref:alpha-L-fucosidase n=1 Tax=Aestuariibaculum sp. M13 TaxID=2967132 RepID=UPI00215A048C|nr:alpha-L-fucosidase [Aestuariibaculum sp. M13]MCR8668713.1 alpha-L-fucosidase [Aestuariibaculum sp. M13]